jgi:cell division protein FtsL
MVLAEKVSMVEAEEPMMVKKQLKLASKTKLNFKKAVSLAGCLLCLTIVNVIVQGLVVEKNYQIRHWERLVQEQERKMMKLEIKIANLESFDRVQTVAKNELGMKTVGPDDYQMIPAVPAEDGPVAQSVPGRLPADESNGMLERIAAWVGGIGKTMANTF